MLLTRTYLEQMSDTAHGDKGRKESAKLKGRSEVEREEYLRARVLGCCFFWGNFELQRDKMVRNFVLFYKQQN